MKKCVALLNKGKMAKNEWENDDSSFFLAL